MQLKTILQLNICFSSKTILFIILVSGGFSASANFFFFFGGIPEGSPPGFFYASSESTERSFSLILTFDYTFSKGSYATSLSLSGPIGATYSCVTIVDY